MKKGATITLLFLFAIIFLNVTYIKNVADVLHQTQFFRNAIYLISLQIVLLFVYVNLINIK